MRILADENIPFADAAFRAFGAVRRLPGHGIGPAEVAEADVLLVRSVTRVDAALLAGTPVRFVGSATIGTDHVDTAGLAARGVAFAHAPGSNAGSVVEYVLAALLRLGVRYGSPLRERTVAVVGCGHIGAPLARRLEAFGARVLRVDPPRAEAARAAGLAHPFMPLADALDAADVVTLHVPLTDDGPHPTRHLVDADVLARMRPGAWLVNASRGRVVDGGALTRALGRERPAAAVLDVWEDEPHLDPALLARVALATPHIAGYSYDGKVAGTRMLHDALAAFLGRPPAWDAADALAPGEDDDLVHEPPDPALPAHRWLDALARRLYDVEADDRRLRAGPAPGTDAFARHFVALRRAYPRRRAWERHRLTGSPPPGLEDAVRRGLGVRTD